MKRRSFLSQIAATAVATTQLRPLTGAASQRAQLTVTDVAERLFVISGGGGNVTVFNSRDGVLLVDGGSPERSADVLKLVRQRTGTSGIHTLFNTHWHWNQTGSNRVLGAAGTRIIAHENTRLWLGTDVESKWEQRTYPRLPPKARPNTTFYTSDTLKFGGEAISYGVLPEAHTDGDIYVAFKEADVLVAADVLSVNSYPLLDYCTNGWIGGMAQATEALLDLCTATTRIIPGSGPMQTREQVQAEHAMLVEVQPRLAKLLAQGMSIQDMLAAAPTRDFDAVWGDPRLFIANAWPGMVRRWGELGVAIV